MRAMTPGKDSPVRGPPYSVFIYRMLQAFYESGLLREYLIPVGRGLRLRVATSQFSRNQMPHNNALRETRGTAASCFAGLVSARH